MSNRSEELTADMPPVTRCPDWCALGWHPWEPDGSEWGRTHEGPAAPGSLDVELYGVEAYQGGVVDASEPPQAVIDGVLLGPEELRTLAAAAFHRAAVLLTAAEYAERPLR